MIAKANRLFIILFIILSLSADICVSETLDRILVVVNGEIITQGELDNLIKARLGRLQKKVSSEKLQEMVEDIRKQLLNQLIEEKLVISEAKKMGIEATEEEISAKIKQVKSGFGSEEEFEDAILQQNLSLSELKEVYRNQIIASKLIELQVRQRIEIMPADINRYYEEHKEEFVQKELVRLKCIFIKPQDPTERTQAKELARRIIELLKGGVDFDDKVLKYSDGPDIEAGGDLGYRQRGELLSEIEDVVFKLDIGEISKVISTETGFYIFKVIDKKPGRLKDLMEVKEQIKDILYQKKFSKRYKEWIGQLKKKAYISFK